MTRRLIVVRHASAASAARGASDHERPLDGAGRRALPWLAHEVTTLGPVDLVLASTATRVRQTVAGLLVGAPAVMVKWLANLYLADVDVLFDVVRGADAGSRCVVLCGHNPGLHQLLLDLAVEDTLGRLATGLPTAAVATFDVDGAWDAVEPKAGRLVSLASPKHRL
jgi:phosphohistidine phosphatase